MPVEESDLVANVLQFRLKSFSYEETRSVHDVEVALFARTETESESQFRPKLIKLRVVVPRPWLLYDLAADAIVIAPDGRNPGPRGTGTALEAAAEKSEFREQGVDWVRSRLPGGDLLYAPRELAGEIGSATGLRALGLGSD